MGETLCQGTGYICWKDPQKSVRKDLADYDIRGMVYKSGDPKPPIEFTERPTLAYYQGNQRFLPKDYLTVDLKDAGGGGNIHQEAGAPAGVSLLEVPITVYNRRTGAGPSPAVLSSRGGEYALTWTTAATYETITASVRAELAYYQVPDGIELVLGHKNAFNSRVLIYLMTHS